jgi:hypothetical protein
MLALHDFPAFPALVLVSVLLVLKMGAVAFATGSGRLRPLRCSGQAATSTIA